MSLLAFRSRCLCYGWMGERGKYFFVRVVSQVADLKTNIIVLIKISLLQQSVSTSTEHSTPVKPPPAKWPTKEKADV